MKKALAALTAALTLCMLGTSASAAGSTQASLSADGRTTYVANSALRGMASPFVVPDGFTVIYSNFNTDPANAYDCCAGWTLSAEGSIVGARQILAMPFTPSADIDIRRLVVAIGYVTGTNHVALSLHADDNGLPGDLIKQGSADDLPVFGGCCDTTAVPARPIHVMGGTQYWVVAKVTDDTWSAWNWNTIGAQGPYAFRADGGWIPANSILSAFAVLGK